MKPLFTNESDRSLYELGLSHGQDLSGYAEFVTSRFKLMPTHLESILHAAVGISGESGELIDAVKKSWIYSKPLDEENLKEELGDILFYIQAMATQLNTNIPELITQNIEKLLRRYPEGYSDAAAQRRADKIGEEK